MVTKYLWEFATPGGGGFPDDDINDHQAFVDAAAFFQARDGFGTLILENGEYIMGVQQLWNVGDPVPPPDWDAWRYPLGSGPRCQSLVASHNGFKLDSCFRFTIQGGTNTTVRYRDCLYYGTFVQDATTGVISSAVGAANDTIGCLTCNNPLHMPQNLDLGLRHAAVGTMFTFKHCDSITVRNVELNGNIDAAILGGRIHADGMQTAYDGVVLFESSRCLIDNVRAHHFGRDGLMLMSKHTANDSLFTDVYPGLVVEMDPDSGGTVIFNNTIQNSSFNWNSRQGISWTGCAGLHVIDTDLNYNGAGRLNWSKPGSGLDIEGVGGPMRVRYGVFDGSRFLHNRLAGVVSDNYQCHGQKDFMFNDCIFKAGAGEIALWPETRGMKFIGCEVFGKVHQLFERAENRPHDPEDDLVFRRTNFYEEDEQWNYIGDYSSDSVWTATCAGFDAHKLDVVNYYPQGGRRAGVVYDSCAFHTNCYANVRFLGRSLEDDFFPYCRDCDSCGVQGNNCPPGSCAISGTYEGSDTAQDARYVKLLNSTLTNTGRKRCGAQTPIFSMALTTTTNLVVNRPTEVRGAINASDAYIVPLANYPFESCYPLYCDTPTVNLTNYNGEFPPCKPFFGLSDTVIHWAFCNPAGVNIPTTPCGSYTLGKTASTSETYLDSTVTFTITVCNNTFFATPVLLSEQLPPSFVVTSANPAWSGADTTLTLNNGQCAVLLITGHFIAFGEHTNTVTLDPNTSITGDELSAFAEVNVVSACEANTVIPDGSYASVVGTVFSGTVNIQGLFIVDDDVTFYNAEVFMEAGAEIVVQDGWLLDIVNSSFTACNGVMWRSITATDGSMVRIQRSFMDDAESLMRALDGSAVWVDQTQFHNNRVAIGIPNTGPTYNNVACWVSNSTFYSQGPMPLPYPGQTTAVGLQGFAALDVHRTTLAFTGGNNIIHHMSNGIVAHGSDVSVSGCRMLAIQPDSVYDYVGNGAGIYAHGGIGWYTLEQEGYGMDYTPSFENCRWGIYTEYMNVRSMLNNMLDMGTAYRADRSGFRNVDILNNKVFAHFHGMELRFNDGAAHILVQHNDITFGDAQCDLCRGYTAILVTEGNIPAPDSRILNNTIRFMNAPHSTYGISMTTAADWLVAENTLLMANNAHNFTGIHLNGCNRPEVSCNTVTGASATSFPMANQSAIRNMMGSDPLISCNDVDQTANGILFNFVTPNADVRGNFFRNHKWPLHLDATAVIGGQTLKGNLWYNAPASGGLGAWYEVSDAQASAYQFLVNPTTINGGNTAPPSWSPPNWFDITSGTNYDCADDEEEDYCSRFNERGKERLTELDLRVANDSLENDPYTDETKWMLKGRLYRKLDANPELQDSLQVMADLYDDLQGSTTAAFKTIDDDQLTLYDLDSSMVAQLQANRVQIEVFMELIKDDMEELGDSTLTSVQRQAILEGISGYRENIGDLSTWNTAALQAASDSKAISADHVRTANTGVTTSELIEDNQKQVNEIYLATIGKDIDTITETQEAELFAIANQCPMLGGNAVFKARSLYWLVDDAQEFDDASICLPHGITVKSLVQQRANAVSVVPNPATNEASLVLANSLDEPGVFILFDALGAEVFRHVVPADLARLTFNTTSLAAALYHYQVRGSSGLIGTGKLTIVR